MRSNKDGKTCQYSWVPVKISVSPSLSARRDKARLHASGLRDGETCRVAWP